MIWGSGTGVRIHSQMFEAGARTTLHIQHLTWSEHNCWTQKIWQKGEHWLWGLLSNEAQVYRHVSVQGNTPRTTSGQVRNNWWFLNWRNETLIWKKKVSYVTVRVEAAGCYILKLCMRPWCSSAVCCMMILDENPFTLSMKTLDLRQLHLFQIFKSIWSSLALNLISVWDHSFLSFICLHSVIMWTSRTAKITIFKKKSPNLMFRCGGIIYIPPLDSSVSGGGSPSEIIFRVSWIILNGWRYRMKSLSHVASYWSARSHFLLFRYYQPVVQFVLPPWRQEHFGSPGSLMIGTKWEVAARERFVCKNKSIFLLNIAIYLEKRRKGQFYSVGFVADFSAGDKGF